MEQILTTMLTDLKIVQGHLLLRASHPKLPIYRQEINDWISCNNSHIKIVEEADTSFNQNKIQFCSVVEYNNNRKSVENLYCGPYANGVIPFALNMHQNKVQPHLDFISIRPFKFKVRPYIKIEDSLIRIKRSREKHQKNEEQQKSSDGKGSICKRHQGVFRCHKREKGQEDSCSGEDKDEKNYHGRKCYCCSNRSNEEDESSNEGGFHRSPLKLKFQRTSGRGLKNWIQQNVEKDEETQQIKNKTYLPLKGKSSTSSRNKSSPSLHFHPLLKMSAHPIAHASSGGLNNLIPSSNRYANSVIESNHNVSTTLSNKWINSKQNQDLNTHNSPSDQKNNVKAKPIKREKYLLAGVKGAHALSGKNGSVIDDQDQVIKQQKQPKISREKHNKNQVQVQKNPSKLGLKQALNQLVGPQRFSEMVEPIQESKFQFVGYSQDEKIPITNLLVQPLEGVEKPNKKSSEQTLPRVRQQSSSKTKNNKEFNNSKSPQTKIETLFTRNNLEQIKNSMHKEQTPLKLPDSQAAKFKPNRIKKIPLAQKMQIIKQQHQKQTLSDSKDKITKNKIEALSGKLKKKKIQPVITENKKQEREQSVEMTRQERKQEPSELQYTRVNQEPPTEQNTNIQFQKQNILSDLKNQPEKCEVTAKKNIQQMKQITEAQDDFSMTQQRIISKDQNVMPNICEAQNENCIFNEQKLSGNAASINDDASTIKEIEYQQEEPSDIVNNHMQNSQGSEASEIDTSRTIPYRSQHNQKQEDIGQNKFNTDKWSMIQEKMKNGSCKESSKQIQLFDGKEPVSSVKVIKSRSEEQFVYQTDKRQQCSQSGLLVENAQRCQQQGHKITDQNEEIQRIEGKTETQLVEQAEQSIESKQFRKSKLKDSVSQGVLLQQGLQIRQLQLNETNKQQQKGETETNNIMQIQQKKKDFQSQSHIEKFSQKVNRPQQSSSMTHQIVNNQVNKNKKITNELINNDASDQIGLDNTQQILSKDEEGIIKINNPKLDQQDINSPLSLNQQQQLLIDIQANDVIQNEQHTLKNIKGEQNKEIAPLVNIQTEEVPVASSKLIISQQENESNQHSQPSHTMQPSQYSSVTQIHLEDRSIIDNNKNILSNNHEKRSQSLLDPTIIKKLQSISEVDQSELMNSNNTHHSQIQNINQQLEIFQRQLFDNIQNELNIQQDRQEQKSSMIEDTQNKGKNDKIDSQAVIQQGQHYSQIINNTNPQHENVNENIKMTKIQQQNNIQTYPVKLSENQSYNQLQKDIQQIDRYNDIEDKKLFQPQIQSEVGNHTDSILKINQRERIQEQILHHNEEGNKNQREEISQKVIKNEISENSRQSALSQPILENNIVQLSQSALQKEEKKQNSFYLMDQKYLSSQKDIEINQSSEHNEENKQKHENNIENQENKKEQNRHLTPSRLQKQQYELMNQDLHQKSSQQPIIEKENEKPQKDRCKLNNIQNQSQEQEQRANVIINQGDQRALQNNNIIKQLQRQKAQNEDDDNLIRQSLGNQKIPQESKPTIQEPIQQQNQKYKSQMIPFTIQETHLEIDDKQNIGQQNGQQQVILQNKQSHFHDEGMQETMPNKEEIRSKVQSQQQFNNQPTLNCNIVATALPSNKQLDSEEKYVSQQENHQKLTTFPSQNGNCLEREEECLNNQVPIQENNSSNEGKTLENKLQPNAIIISKPELQQINKKQQIQSSEPIAVNEVLGIRQTPSQQKLNSLKQNKEVVSQQICKPKDEQKIVQTQKLSHKQQQALTLPNGEDTNQQKNPHDQKQSIITPLHQETIDKQTKSQNPTTHQNRNNQQIKKQSTNSVKTIQNNPIQTTCPNQKLLQIKQNRMQRQEKGKIKNSKVKQQVKNKRTRTNEQKGGSKNKSKQQKQEKNPPTIVKQIIVKPFIEEESDHTNKNEYNAQRLNNSSKQSQSCCKTQNELQNKGQQNAIENPVSKEMVSQSKQSQKYHPKPQIQQDINQQLSNKLKENIKTDLPEKILNDKDQQIQNEKRKKQCLLNTISVQTDELLKSFKEIETSQLINNIIPISTLGRQHKIQVQPIQNLSKQIKKQKLMACDPQFARLSGESSKVQIEQLNDSNTGNNNSSIKKRNICLSQSGNQFYHQKEQQSQTIIQNNKSKIVKREQHTINANNYQGNMEGVGQNQKLQSQSSLKLGGKIRQNNPTNYDQSAGSINLSSSSKIQLQQDIIGDNKNSPQTLLNKEIDLNQSIEGENHQLAIKLKNKKQIQISHPLIIKNIVSSNTPVVEFKLDLIHLDKDYKKQEIIDNALSFIDYHLPNFTSLLINKQNTQICFFVEGRWTIYKSESSSQTFTLKNVLFLTLKEQSIFKCIDMITGMPMRILRDKQQGANNKRLLKSIKTLLEKKENQEYEKILYSVNKVTHEIVCLQKIRNFLDNNNELKVILECKKFNKQSQQSQQSQQSNQIYNFQGQSAQQFVQIHLLSSIKYLTFEVNSKAINTYELQLANVVIYLNGTYKFILYQEFNKNQYKLAKESYKWMGYRCPQTTTKFLLIIEPIPDMEGQDRITLRLGLSKNQQLNSVYRLISSQQGAKTRNYQGGYQNVTNLYLPVIKEIIKGKTVKHEKVEKQ